MTDKVNYAFLDRDGTLIFEPLDTKQVDNLGQLRLLDGVAEGLKAIMDRGYKLVLVSNQDGLGTPAFPRAKFEAVQRRFLRILEENGVTFDAILICPHLPSDECNCRKPKTGLLDELLATTTINKEMSFVCGDRETDREFATNVGVRFVKMQTNSDFAAVSLKLSEERIL